MFLLVGTILLAIGIIFLLQKISGKRLKITILRLSILAVSFALIATFTVHGIWLGLSVLIIGELWLSYLQSKFNNSEKRIKE